MLNVRSLPAWSGAAFSIAYSAVKMQRRRPAPPRQPLAVPTLVQVEPVSFVGPLRYAHVEERMDKPGFLQFYNEHVAPALVTQEAAFDLMAVKLAYRINEGDRVHLNVSSSLDREPVRDVAPSYEVAQTLTGRRGCVVHLLKPPLGGGAPKKRVIVLFRGTQKKASPSGLRANVDLSGVGRRAFAEVQPEVDVWVKDAVKAGHEVSIVGHSLGGACGMHLFANLATNLQSRCRLFIYNGPKSTADVVERVVDAVQRIFISCSPTDFISYGGRVWPKGVRVIAPVMGNLWARMTPHRRPRLAEQQLNGEPFAYAEYRPFMLLRFLPVDKTRLIFGIVFPWAFPP